MIDSPDWLPFIRARLRQVPFDEFLALVSRISWLRQGAPDKLRNLVSEAGVGDPEGILYLRDYQLAFLVKILIEERLAPTPEAWPDELVGKVAVLLDLSKLVNWVFPKADADDLGKVDELMIRVGYQQLREQAGVRSLFSRAFLLFDECARDVRPGGRQEFDELLRRNFGVDQEEMQLLAIALFGFFIDYTHPQFFTRDDLVRDPSPLATMPSLVDRALDLFSATPEQLDQIATDRRRGIEDGFELYYFNPLEERPIVALEGGRYVIPIAHFLMRRVTTGLFYYIIAGGEKKGFGDLIGKSIERYVERLILSLPQHGVPTRPPSGLKKVKVCDWIVDEPNTVLLIECKRRSLLQPAKATGRRNDIKVSLGEGRNVAHGLTQVASTARLVVEGKVPGVDRRKPILGLVLTLDDFFFPNTKFVRAVVSDIVSEQQLDDISLEYQLGDMTDFESAVGYAEASGEYLSDVLWRKHSDPAAREMDTATWVRRERAGKIAALPTLLSKTDGLVALLKRFGFDQSLGL